MEFETSLLQSQLHRYIRGGINIYLMKNPRRCCSDTDNYPVGAKATDRFSKQMSNAKFDIDLWECVSQLYRQVAVMWPIGTT